MMHRTLTRTAILISAFTLTYQVANAGENGTLSLDARLRFETADVDGLRDADNLSLRLRPGYLTPEWNGFQAMAEGEFTLVTDRNSYNAAGVHGDTSKAVIADPENAQLDQLWASYNNYDTVVKVGRQLINLNNQRWVGGVAWRQNRQTFDAASIRNTSMENLTLFYAFVDNVVRIFGDEAPASGGNAEEFGSESHLANASYKAGSLGTFTGYGYFIDLSDSPGKIAGSDTIGASYQGSYDVAEDVPVGLYLEYANQQDAGDNVQSYSADYFHAILNTTVEGLGIAVGYELLGSDAAGVDTNGAPTFASVKAPLSTAHKFNGFADVFLVTPDKGLEDAYIQLSYTANLGESLGPVTAKVWYHDFTSDEGGADLGDEIDAVLVKPIPVKGLPGKLVALAKFADYNAPAGGKDVQRFSAELNYIGSF